jgi:lysozyme
LESPVTQSQFDAMLCLAYNIGYGAFAGSTLLKKVNGGDIAGAADEFLRWDKATNQKTGKKEPLAGLTKRRTRERRLFLGEV